MDDKEKIQDIIREIDDRHIRLSKLRHSLLNCNEGYIEEFLEKVSRVLKGIKL
jgi:hypothetical protein